MRRLETFQKAMLFRKSGSIGEKNTFTYYLKVPLAIQFIVNHAIYDLFCRHGESSVELTSVCWPYTPAESSVELTSVCRPYTPAESSVELTSVCRPCTPAESDSPAAS